MASKDIHQGKNKKSRSSEYRKEITCPKCGERIEINIHAVAQVTKVEVLTRQ